MLGGWGVGRWGVGRGEREARAGLGAGGPGPRLMGGGASEDETRWPPRPPSPGAHFTVTGDSMPIAGRRFPGT